MGPAGNSLGGMSLDPKLLAILACPEDKGPLLWFADESALYNPRLRRRYAVRDGVPVMLVDEAESVDDGEHEREVDVPDQARADQGELLAQRDVGLGQKPFADPDGPQAIIRDGLKTAHALAPSMPARVACPRARRRDSRAKPISLSLVNRR